MKHIFIALLVLRVAWFSEYGTQKFEADVIGTSYCEQECNLIVRFDTGGLSAIDCGRVTDSWWAPAK
jgi:hypothetical protein